MIHLCPDGSIQVLSAVDDNSNENQIINQQQYRLNYSNSAVTPSIQQYEETAAVTHQSHSTNEIHFDHYSVVSLQQKKTLFKYDRLLESSLPPATEIQLNSDHSKTISQDIDPIVKINLDLTDETMEINSEDDDNSLPEIFFKRIIAPTPRTEISDLCTPNRHNRSRSHTNKQTMNMDR